MTRLAEALRQRRARLPAESPSPTTGDAGNA